MTTNIPDRNNEPYKSPIPFVCPIRIIGATAVKVQPNTIGKPVPYLSTLVRMLLIHT